MSSDLEDVMCSASNKDAVNVDVEQEVKQPQTVSTFFIFTGTRHDSTLNSQSQRCAKTRGG